MKLADEIKKVVQLEVRPSETEDNYFEAVFQSKDLDALLSVIREHVGDSIKSPGKRAKFPKDINKLVNSIGGLRPDQSFYFKQEPSGEYVYAALWPWQSDPSRITLKIGTGHLPA